MSDYCLFSIIAVLAGCYLVLALYEFIAVPRQRRRRKP